MKKIVALLNFNPTIDVLFRDVDFEFNRKYFYKESDIAAGGFAANVGRGLKNLGKSFTIYTIAGGYAGGMFRTKLSDEGLQFRLCENKAETRITAIVETNRKYMNVAPSPQLDRDAVKRLIDLVWKDEHKFDFVAMGGSVPQNVSDIVLQKLVLPLIECGKKVVVDTRGTFADQIYPHLPFAARYNGHSYQNAVRLHRSGVPLVLYVSNHLCYGIFNDVVVKYPYYTRFVPRGYGRGDAFLAGLISAHVDGLDYHQAVVRAISSSASFVADFPLGNISSAMMSKFDRLIQRGAGKE